MKHITHLLVVLMFSLAACKNEQLIGPQVEKDLIQGEWLQVPYEDLERRVIFSAITYKSVLRDGKSQRVMGSEQLKYEWLDGHRFRNERGIVYIVDELTDKDLVYHVEGKGHLSSRFARVK